MIGDNDMLKVYIDEKALSSICLEEMSKPIEEQCDWFRILSKQETIYYISSNGDDIFLDDDNPLMLFSQAMQLDYENASAYIKGVLTDNSRVLEQPCAAFLLDVDPQTAEKIQKDYGVLVQPTQSLDTGVAGTLEIGEAYSFDNGESGCSWKYVLDGIKDVPSNSLFIIDRNLFANDSQSRRNGIDNIQNILDSVLPETFAGVYQIAIVFDPGTLHKDCTYEYIATELNKLKKTLNKTYTISISVIGLNVASQYYADTHNRRILSNYYWVYADHKLCAFVNNHSNASQYMTVNGLYAYLSTMKGNRDAASNKEHTKLIRKFSDLIKELRRLIDNESIRATYRLTINGNHKLSINELDNRLLSC